MQTADWDSPDWPLANAESPATHSLKNGEVLQCISLSIVFVPKFTYEALCSDCERLATFYMVVILDSQREANLDYTTDWDSGVEWNKLVEKMSKLKAFEI